MTVSVAALTEALAAVVGPERLLTGLSPLGRYQVDGLLPRWVALPSGAEEVSRLLRIAAEEGLAVVPRGSGSLMGLGNLPRRVDLVLDLSRLCEVVAYEPDDLTVSVQCGVPLALLEARLSGRRQFLPLDPLEGMARSVGGVLASGGSGPLRFRYGTPRDLLLGVRFVQADGTLTWGGARVVKSVTGYDIPKLMVGSLGTLGILVEATLRLHPLPEAEGTWLAIFSSPTGAAAFLARIVDSALQPSRLEILAGPVLDGRPGRSLAIAVSFGSVAEAVRAQGESVETLARGEGGTSEPAEPAIWSRLGAGLAGSALGLRVATLPSETVALAADVGRLADRLGVAASVVGEAGNGVLHVGFAPALPPETGESEIILPLRARVGPAGGSVTLDRASPQLKERLDVWGPLDPAVVAIMRRLKAEFDPGGVLNPGRFVDRI